MALVLLCNSDESQIMLPGADAYFCSAPRAPNLQDLQIPKPLPLAWIKAQKLVSFANSVGDSSAMEKGVSVC